MTLEAKIKWVRRLWVVVAIMWCLVIALDVYVAMRPSHVSVSYNGKPCSKIAKNTWQC